MHKRIATWMTLTIGLLVILLPILAALYLAHWQSVDEANERASVMARELLRRIDVVGRQAISAYHDLHEQNLADPCSQRGVDLMRDIGMKFNYIEAAGYVRGNRLTCSSFGRYSEGLALGPAAYVSALNAKVRPSVDLGLRNGHRFLVLEKGHFAVAIHPVTLLDVFTDQHDVALGIFGVSSGLPMAKRGVFDSAWPARLGSARKIVFSDGRHLIAIERSADFDFAAYAAIPVAWVRMRLHDSAIKLVPLGLLLGLGLLTVVILLARQQNSLPAILRTALKKKEFVLHYQPIVALATGRLKGVEALLRWPQSGKPDVRPAMFIPAAEDCGLIGKFTAYVLERIASEAPAFFARYPDCYISINLSPADLHSGNIIESLRRLIDVPGISAHNLMVEVTEYSLVDVEQAGPNVRRIRDLGIRVAIDDFGTGFSNLSQLATLKTDCLKIDKLFVETGGTDSATSQVALHIIQVADSLGLIAIAEGVETEAQARFLREHGVEYAQGWLFEKAVPMEELLEINAQGWAVPAQAPVSGA